MDRTQYFEDDQRQRRLDAKRATIKDWVDQGSRAVADGDWLQVGLILRDVLLPELGASRRDYPRYNHVLQGTDETWTPDALQTVSKHIDRYLTAAQQGTLTRRQTQRLIDAFESAVSIAAVDGLIDSTLVSEVPAWEYEHQVGVRHYSPTSAADKEPQLIDPDPDAELKATLVTGGQGSGKSTFVETLVEDRIARGHVVVDLLDFVKSENAMYDIEQRQTVLNDIREDMGLDLGFEDHNPPSVEVYAPLTDGLATSKVPFNTETEEYVLKPFTIPASELTYRQLVMLLPHSTRTQENYLKSAHQKLSQTGEDWTLRDIARVVRNETNAGETVADRIERALQTAQETGYIRDQDDDHTLNWSEVASDPSTIASFTIHMVRESADQKVIASYLLDSLYEYRKGLIQQRKLQESDTLTVVMRELHKIVPRSKSEQDSVATIESYMIDTMSDLLALTRHVDMEIIADTQKFKQQLSSDVSGMFHRVFAFSGQKPDVREVFKTRVDDTGPAETVAQFEPGECAMVSGAGYVMPISTAPPRSHHLDTGGDGDGLSARVAFLDHEEFVDAPWSSTVPPHLAFSDQPNNPAEIFCERWLTTVKDRQQHEFKQEITDAYNAWATANDYETMSHQAVHTTVKNYFDTIEDARLTHPEKGKATPAIRKLKLTYTAPDEPDEGGDMGYVT